MEVRVNRRFPKKKKKRFCCLFFPDREFQFIWLPIEDGRGKRKEEAV